jgi:hypothetical protein
VLSTIGHDQGKRLCVSLRNAPGTDARRLFETFLKKIDKLEETAALEAGEGEE